nr:GNAT family N-acetyltransferase [Cohnella lubricantis]
MRGIVRLVRTQLVPLSPWQHPRDGRLYDEIKERLRVGNTLVAVKNRFGEPIGFLHLIVQDSSLFIDLLAVDPNQQNRHWGTQLMQRAEEFGRAHSCRIAYLYVDEGNYRGQRFYKRIGYETTQYVKELRCYRMEKAIVHPLGEWPIFGGS